MLLEGIGECDSFEDLDAGDTISDIWSTVIGWCGWLWSIDDWELVEGVDLITDEDGAVLVGTELFLDITGGRTGDRPGGLDASVGECPGLLWSVAGGLDEDGTAAGTGTDPLAVDVGSVIL